MSAPAQRLAASSDRDPKDTPAGSAERRSPKGWVTVASLVLVALATVGVWLASDVGAPSMQERVQTISESLRCPACAGESVAQSQSDMASQMRAVIAQQVAEGRSDAQVRGWFAQRYGDSVLTDPPWHGPGLALQLAPAIVLLCGVLVLVAVRRPSWRAPLTRTASVLVAGVALAAVVSALR